MSRSNFGAAPNGQYSPHVASNGDIALAVWTDRRSGGYRFYGSRIGHDGQPLDPFGIPIPFFPATVVWNGNEFVVVGNELLLIGSDGVVRGRKALDVQSGFGFAAALPGSSGVRLLFVNSYSPGTARGTIFDDRGQVVAADIALWTPPAGSFTGIWIAGTSSDGFLILHEERPESLGPRRIIATILDGNGRLVTSTDSHLSIDYLDPQQYVVSGGEDGFLLVTQRWLDSAVVATHLDAAGVVDRQPQTLAPADANARVGNNTAPALVRDRDRYVIAWNTSMYSGASYGYLMDSTVLGEAGTTRRVDAWPGITGGVALAATGSHRVLVTAVAQLYTSSASDVFAHTLSDTLQPGPLQLLSSSATLQSRAHVAVSRFGYAVTWSENGPDPNVHLFLRRFSFFGDPQDAAPIELRRREQDFGGTTSIDSRIVSNGDTYLVAWPGDSGWSLRRLAAESGDWVDAQPFEVATYTLAMASNGTDALIAWSAPCGDYSKACVNTRRIRLVGDALADPQNAISSPAYPGLPAIASSGSDYLLAWTEADQNPGIICSACSAPPWRLLASRVRAGGTVIDPVPLRIDDRNLYPSSPSLAWNGGNYVISWTDGNSIRATRITGEGSVLDHDALTNGVVIDRGTTYDSATASILARGSDFVLLVQRFNSQSMTPNVWTAVEFSDTDLNGVASMPRTLLSAFDNVSYGFFTAAAYGQRLLLAYDRPGSVGEGEVPRVVTRVFGQPDRRRAVAH